MMPFDASQSASSNLAHGHVESSPASQAGKWQHPVSFYCPISQQCMRDPVVLSDGHTYERRCIETWLQEHDTSPVTGVKLGPGGRAFPNHALRNAVEEYFQQVFSAHRRAIRSTLSAGGPWELPGLCANAALIHTVDALMQCSLLVNADLSTERVLRQIIGEAKTLVGAEAASVFLVDHDRQELYSTVNSTNSELRIPFGAGIAGHVARTGEPLLIRDAYEDARFDRSVDAKTGFRTRHILCVPLKKRGAGVLGVVQLINKTGVGVLSADSQQDGGAAGTSAAPSLADGMQESEEVESDGFTAEDLQFLQVFASQAATAVADSAALDKLQPRQQAAEACDTGSVAKGTPLVTVTEAQDAEVVKEAQRTPAPGGGQGLAADEDGVAREPGCGPLALGTAPSPGSALRGILRQTSGPEQSRAPVFRGILKKPRRVHRSAQTSGPVQSQAPVKRGLLKRNHWVFSETEVQVVAALAVFSEVEESGAPSPSVVASPEDDVARAARVAELLAAAFGGWQTDTLALAELTGNKPLSVLGLHLFDRLGLVERFRLDWGKLARFLSEIERGYDDGNTYHNRAHAASVLHMMHALLAHGGVAEAVAPAFGGEGHDGQLETMACLLAAAVHDYEHLGVSNDFLVKTSDERALQYNDRHANEHHHATASFAVLRRPECNFLAHLPAADYRRLRSLVVELVLGTDMAESAAILKRFAEATEGPAAAFVPTSAKDASLLLQVAMKTADMGHLALGWDLHGRWVERLEEEFFAQGDREKAFGLDPVSFLMDRDKPGVTQTQLGFFEHVALPLFRTLASAAPLAGPMLSVVEANHQRWRDVDMAKSGAGAVEESAL